jgi:hypothetical protein
MFSSINGGRHLRFYADVPVRRLTFPSQAPSTRELRLHARRNLGYERESGRRN